LAKIQPKESLPKVHTYLRQLAFSSFDVIEQELFDLPEFPFPHPDGWVAGSLDEVEDLLKLSQRSDLVVRFKDQGFYQITTAWRWLAPGIGLAHLIVGGRIEQVHLMLTGTGLHHEPVARAWLEQAGVNPDDAMPTRDGPALITLEREGYGDPAGGYLLGMILISPFCEYCGVADDT
jgi:hypothetical protein